jgi:hypothetical protein
LFVDAPGTQLARVLSNRRVALEFILLRMTLNAREVQLLDIPRGELRLQQRREAMHPREDYNTRGVGIQPMHGPKLVRAIHAVQNRLERIAIKPARRLNRQWRRLIDDNDRRIFVQHANRVVYVRLGGGRHPMKVVLARSHAPERSYRHAIPVQPKLLPEPLQPVICREMRKDSAKRFE